MTVDQFDIEHRLTTTIATLVSLGNTGELTKARRRDR